MYALPMCIWGGGVAAFQRVGVARVLHVLEHVSIMVYSIIISMYDLVLCQGISR